MITAYTSPDIIKVHRAKELLDDAKIECIIQNQTISFLAGEVPFAATWPQVDIVDEKRLEEAKKVLEEMNVETKVLPEEDWNCSNCGEGHSGQFDACWKCGAERPF